MGVDAPRSTLLFILYKYGMTQDIRHYIKIICESYLAQEVPEEFITTTIKGAEFNVHWNKQKSATNKSKHGYTFDQAISVLNDPAALVYEDEIYNEQRFRTIGQTDSLDIVSVAWSSIDTGEDTLCIRIVSIRDTTAGEKALYRKTQMTTKQNESQPVLEQFELEDQPEIPADAKLVPMQVVIDRLVAKFKARKATLST